MRVVPVALLTVVCLAACTRTGGDDTSDADDAAVEAPDVTEPASRASPFCQRMLDLDAELPDDPAIDTREQVLAAYTAALPDVPPEIDAEFRVVLAALEAGPDATSSNTTTNTDVSVLDAPPTTPVGSATSGRTPEAGIGSSTTLPSAEALYPEEGWLPDDDPAARVNAYIDFACRGTTNNPGPPPTEPGTPAVDSPDP